MDIKKVQKLTSDLNSFIIFINAYCQKYSNCETMVELLQILPYVNKLIGRLYIEVDAHEILPD